MARKFFYICAGLLMLALAYHLGVSTVEAQIGGASAVAQININPESYSLLSGRTIHAFEPFGAPGGTPVTYTFTVPGTAEIVAVNDLAAGAGGNFYALLANGDCYRGTGPGAPMALMGNVFSGGPTPALRQSWGQVKARYQNTPGMTVTPGADKR